METIQSSVKFMNKAVARHNIIVAQAALNTVGVEPFLVDGTLLGAIREKDFIAHDKDTDFGIFIEQYTPDITKAMVQAGFKVGRVFGTIDKGLELSFRRHKIKLDLFFYYSDDNTRYHAAWPKNQEPIKYTYWKFDLKPVVFLSHTFLAPDDPERFLTTKYGDWKTPVEVWDWAWGPKNATPWGSK